MYDAFNAVTSALGLGVGVIGLLVGLVGVVVAACLGALAAWIAYQQKEMQREQHKFFREQRDKKPDLELWVTGMQPEGDGATMLTFSVRNGGNAVADGFAWEIILPCSVFPFVEFEVDDDVVWTTTDYPNVTNVNFFRKEVHVPKLFVGDLVSVASIVVKEQSFEPFAIQWRLYSAHGTVPESGHKTIRVAPRPQGLLDVHPVLQIPAVLPV